MTLLAKSRKVILWVIFNVIAVIFIVALCEGFSSLVLFLQAISEARPLAERRHTQYDELLGWVNIRNLDIKDMYGPGVYLRTNSQSFRNNRDFQVNIPHNKIRIICSGDSFTFGYGVDNDHTWCERLTTQDSRLETVNMGQGGYGIDQAYLWYKRDGSKLGHNLQIFAFVTNDFRRMERDSFSGYGKPLLKLQKGRLQTTNVPVPRRAFYMPWIMQNRKAIDGLKSIQLLRNLFFQGDVKTEAEAGDLPTYDPASSEEIAFKILEDLVRLNKAKNSTLVLVYLPGQNFTDRDLKHWRQQVHTASERLGIIFIDLIDEFKDLPPDELAKMFIQEGQVTDYSLAAGHYTVKGNQYVADALYKRLLASPEILNKLTEISQK